MARWRDEGDSAGASEVRSDPSRAVLPGTIFEGPITQVSVIIATAGRPGAAQAVMDAIAAMGPLLSEAGITLEGIVSAPSAGDVAGIVLPKEWRLVLGRRGLTAQRNVALDSLNVQTCAVFFFDDDAIPRADYIMTAVGVFYRHPELVALTGNVVVDGVREGREISCQEATRALERSNESHPFGDIGAVDCQYKELYGCNFAIRLPVLGGLRFDEALPLYSWLEDRDFACRSLRFGMIGRVEGCIVVHRGSESGGRLSHLRFGYSQVANPVYLFQKGSFNLGLTVRQVLRPGLKNLVLTVGSLGRNELRRTRLLGNAVAVRDIVSERGRADPGRILEF